MKQTKRILFAGYAPVHFLCFLPVYQRLIEDNRLEIYLSGGFREKTNDQVAYKLEEFYDHFPVPSESIIPIDQARSESFDVLVCSHLSDDFFPRSVGKAVQIFHGVSFKNLAVRDKALRYDFLCLPGRYHAEKYVQAGLVREGGAQCLITGFPKCDALIQGELDRSNLLRRLGLNPAFPIVLFAPTGEKHNALETAGKNILESFGRASNINLLIKPHDHPKNKINWFEKLAPFESDHIRLVKDLDVIPQLHAADVLITDASSVAVEYTLLNRPIIFIDVPKLFKRVEKRAPSMDLETYGRKIGTVVKEPENTLEIVQQSLASPQQNQEIRQAMAKHVFHGPGQAAETVAEVILHAAGLRDEPPPSAEWIQPGQGMPLGQVA